MQYENEKLQNVQGRIEAIGKETSWKVAQMFSEYLLVQCTYTMDKIREYPYQTIMYSSLGKSCVVDDTWLAFIANLNINILLIETLSIM